MIVTLTTDFGPGEYVAAMKGVLLSIDPEATIVDLDHGIPPQNVRQGAYAMFAATPFYPEAVHIGVVDPGVGTHRRPLMLLSERGMFVGPDNGLLVPAAERAGLLEARALTERKYFRADVSDTFHGRDIFAPVGAHLSKGIDPRSVGPKVDDFVPLDFGRPAESPKELAGAVLVVDRFGNVITNIPRALVEKHVALGKSVRVQVGGYELDLALVPTYGHARRGQLLATFSSSGFLEIAEREGRAADALSAAPDTPVSVRFR